MQSPAQSYLSFEPGLAGWGKSACKGPIETMKPVCEYTQGIIVMEYFLYKLGVDSYVRLITQGNNLPFPVRFENATKVSLINFYAEVNEYLTLKGWNSPAPTPKPVIIPKSFAELKGNTDGAAIAAWKSANGKIVASNPVKVTQNVYVGPKTVLPNTGIREVFENGTRLFAGFNQPKSFFAIYYTFEDKDWAKAKLLELNQPNRVQEIDGSCVSAVRCNGASAGKASNDVGFSQFSVSKESSTYHLRGGIELHEYAHIVQAMQFVGKPKDDRSFEYLPRWLIEGHAHLAGIAGAAKTLEEYQQNRRDWLNTTPNQEIKSFSPENIERFYSSLMPGKYNADMFGYVYTLGYFTLESLVALKGIDSPMELILQVSNGATFEEAFEKVYEISWDKAAPILAETVSRMFLERK
jgi:hypothetical protein